MVVSMECLEHMHTGPGAAGNQQLIVAGASALQLVNFDGAPDRPDVWIVG